MSIDQSLSIYVFVVIEDIMRCEYTRVNQGIINIPLFILFCKCTKDYCASYNQRKISYCHTDAICKFLIIFQFIGLKVLMIQN